MNREGPTTGPMVASNRPKAPYNFTRFDLLMDQLQGWRGDDHEDQIILHRSHIIEIVEGTKALRRALEEIYEEVGTSTKASLIARTALSRSTGRRDAAEPQ